MNYEKDYYRTLEVPRKATLKEIKAAYRKLALKFHPDRAPDNLKDDAEIIFKEITEAYEILSDRKKKTSYDLHYNTPRPPPAPNAAHQRENDFITRFNGPLSLSPSKKGRILSLVILIAFFVFQYYRGSFHGRINGCACLSFALIWFGHKFNGVDGYPGIAYVFLGWVGLISVILVAIFLT